jgi:hypothetical protein
MISYLDRIDRRVIFLFVALSLSIPVFLEINLKPAKMAATLSFFQSVEKLEPEPGKFVLISADWGPSTMAENKPQTMVAIEHLMRKRIPFALISVTPIAAPFLEELPKLVKEELEKEFEGQNWKYGRDWVNFGFKPGGMLMVQNLGKTKDLIEHLKTDARATPLSDIPMMRGVASIEDVQMLMEFTGSVGIFNVWLQFFSGPPYVHGCTSISIPEAFNYYSTGQIVGLFEGVAGAAYYESLLSEKYSSRKKGGLASSINSGLSFAQLGVFGFIFLGNLGLFLTYWKNRRERT